MDLALIQKMLRDLQASSSHKESSADVQIRGNEIIAFFRPCGYGNGQPFIIEYAPTPEEAISKVTKAWEEMSSRIKTEQTKKLALAIIRITHEQGQCTDAALRTEFSSREIEMFSDDALQLADTMALNGPFKIVELAGANAA